MGDIVGVAVGREWMSVDFRVVLDASEGAGSSTEIDVNCVKRLVCDHSLNLNHLRHLVEEKPSRLCAE